VTINVTGNNLVGVNITEEVDNITSVTYNRPFTSGQASTVILPFSYECKGNEGGKFYAFKEVTYDEAEQEWVAVMEETAENTLAANTPYVFMPNGTTMTFPNIENMYYGIVTLQPTTDVVYGGATTDADWQFHGTYQTKEWTELSTDYGFAATSGESVDAQSVVAGQFVRFTGDGTTNAFVKPTRCYLSYVGSSAPARAMTRGAANGLPQSITVRLVDRNGVTTTIGSIENGELIIENDADNWYTLDGLKLNGKPMQKGLYINNGKKVAIK
jgi:hypothetical protein